MTQAYLYKWEEVSTDKWYIGSRTKNKCHINDGYICSSKVVNPMINSNPHNWTHRILVVGNPKYIREIEAIYLKKLDAKNNPMSYNQHNGDGNFSRIGIIPSMETRAKIGEASRNRSAETRAKLSAANKKRIVSAETRAKISASMQGKTYTSLRREYKKVMCPHCGKNGGINNMKRWHFDNCKQFL